MNNFFVIFADGQLDGIAQTKRHADKHKRDLINMGCAPVTMLGPMSGCMADDVESALADGKSMAFVRRMVKQQA